VAISASAAPAAQQASVSGSKITLRYMYDTPPGEKVWHAKVKTDYEQLNPNITLQPEVLGADWVNKTLAALAAGTGPDIVTGFGLIFLSFIEKGAFVELTPIINQWLASYDIADFYPVSLKEVQYQGKQYGLPYSFDPSSIMYYMKPDLDAAGVAYPDTSWTYDDFQKDLIALTRKDSSGKTTQWGFNGSESLQGGGWARMLPAIWAYGGAQYSSDMTKCLLDQSQALLAVNMFYKLKVQYGTSPTLADTGKQNPYQMFASGQCAMQTSGPWAIGTYQSTITTPTLKDQWDIAPPPQGPKGRFALATGSQWGLNKATPHLPEAGALLRYLTDQTRSKEVASIARRLPARKSAAAAFVLPNTTPAHQSVFSDSLAYANVMQYHTPVLETKVQGVLNSAWTDIIGLQKGPPEPLWTQAVAQVNQFLATG
jgi:multiple sugar transport system substrate-binding protein